jgi:hypothetical protein
MVSSNCSGLLPERETASEQAWHGHQHNLLIIRGFLIVSTGTFATTIVYIDPSRLDEDVQSPTVRHRRKLLDAIAALRNDTSTPGPCSGSPGVPFTLA